MNWIKDGERQVGDRPARAVESEEVRALRRRVAQLERANEILKTSAGVFRAGGARPPTAVIVDYIDSHQGSMGVEPICTVLAEAGVPIAPSTYYAHRAAPISPAALEQAYLVNALVDLWRANWGVYGARKLWRAARRAGLDVGRDQVARLMAIGGITGAVRGRHRTRTTQRDEQAARHPDLVGRGWNRPTGIDQLWVADFPYV